MGRHTHSLHDQTPEDKPAQTPRSTARLLIRCGKIGPHIGTVAEQNYRRDGPASIRRIMGLTGLARKHGAALTDDDCAAALEAGFPANPSSIASLLKQ